MSTEYLIRLNVFLVKVLIVKIQSKLFPNVDEWCLLKNANVIHIHVDDVIKIHALEIVTFSTAGFLAQYHAGDVDRSVDVEV